MVTYTLSLPDAANSLKCQEMAEQVYCVFTMAQIFVYKATSFVGSIESLLTRKFTEPIYSEVKRIIRFLKVTSSNPGRRLPILTEDFRGLLNNSRWTLG